MAVVVVVVGCSDRKPTPDARVARRGAVADAGFTSPPFHIELPGVRIDGAGPTPDGGAALALVITRPLKLGATTFEPSRGPDAVIVWIAGDGQPVAAHSFGLDGIDRVRMTNMVVTPDGDVQVELVTSAAVPGAEGEPAIEPGGSEMLTRALVERAAGVTSLRAVRTVPRIDTTWNGDLELTDGAMLRWGACEADRSAACIERTQ